jgi:hypothetical protein
MYRAVTISTQPATLQVTAPASFGKAPALGVAHTRPLGAGHRRSFSAGVSVQKEWNESNWSICRPLNQVPLGFPLERTRREIYGEDAAVVANRISNAMRNMSVETEYDGENAKAKCTSLDQVSFRIRLFAGGEDGLPVIVEVQRRSGSTSSFMKICRQILDGAEGGEVTKSTSKPCTKMPPFIKGAIGNMTCLQSVLKKKDGKPELDALNKSIELLQCPKKSSNLLGLENLCFLTDALKTRPDMALSSSKDIVLGRRSTELREKVVAILQKDALLPDQYSPEPLAIQSRHMALVLLSNSLLLTSKDGCLADAVESQKWFSDTLIPTLLDEVKSFKMSSNNAYEAACSLASLANCSDVARKIMKENAALEYLRAAHHYGKENHELLSTETELTLIALGAPI